MKLFNEHLESTFHTNCDDYGRCLETHKVKLQATRTQVTTNLFARTTLQGAKSQINIRMLLNDWSQTIPKEQVSVLEFGKSQSHRSKESTLNLPPISIIPPPLVPKNMLPYL